MKTKSIITILTLSLLLPQISKALEMPAVPEVLPPEVNLTAKAYIVTDTQSGKVLLSKNENMQWPTASMAKLVTAMVFLDSNPDLQKTVTVKKTDDSAGVVLKTKPGAVYKLKDIFYSAIIPSANNAAKILARSSGVSLVNFVEKMNKKAQELGAVNTVFFEPTGLSKKNLSTAQDFARIVEAALKYPEISAASALSKYSFSTFGGPYRLRHKVESTNKLLGDMDINVLGGKTGYIQESQRNFSGEVLDKFGNAFTVVVLGSQSTSTQFKEVKDLAFYAGLHKFFSQPAVLGTSTVVK